MPSVRSNLRDRLQRGETIVAPGAYDPLSARVVQALGFAAVYPIFTSWRLVNNLTH